MNRAFEAGLDLDDVNKANKFTLKSSQLVLTNRKALNLVHFHEDKTAKNYLMSFIDNATIRLERVERRTVDKLLDTLLQDVFR